MKEHWVTVAPFCFKLLPFLYIPVRITWRPLHHASLRNHCITVHLETIASRFTSSHHNIMRHWFPSIHHASLVPIITSQVTGFHHDIMHTGFHYDSMDHWFPSWHGFQGWVWSMASLGDTLVTGSWDTHIRTWDLAGGHMNMTADMKYVKSGVVG